MKQQVCHAVRSAGGAPPELVVVELLHGDPDPAWELAQVADDLQPEALREGDGIGKNDGTILSIDDNLMLVKETYVDFVGDKTTKEIEMRVRQGQGG